MFTLSLYLIARAMFVHVPDLARALILVPLGMVAGSLPLAPAGFGAFEFAIEKLYKIIPAADRHRCGRHPRGTWCTGCSRSWWR